MDITINGNINFNGNSNLSGNCLLDNEATFKDLLACLKDRAGTDDVLVKEKRRPGSEQLRSSHELIAQITVVEATCEVYENAYGIYDNGDRRTVIWIPDCPKAAKYYYPATYDEKCKKERQLCSEDEDLDPEYGRIIKDTEPGEDRLDEEQLAGMVWYLAVVIAGENQIEHNLEHPISAGTRSDRNADEDDSPRYHWSSGAHFQNPEDEVIWKEEKAERCADLTEKQREVYQLYYVDGFTLCEIADMLGMTHQCISKRLKGIRKIISNYYENH